MKTECKLCYEPLRTKEEQERGTCDACEIAIDQLIENRLVGF